MGAERRKGSDWVYGKKKKGSVTRDWQVQRLCGRMDCAVLKQMERARTFKAMPKTSAGCGESMLSKGMVCVWEDSSGC